MTFILRFKIKLFFNRWESLGIEHFLLDKQTDEYPVPGTRDKIVLTDMLDMIEQKYSMLRQRLLQMMLRQFSGETTWEILDESEKFDLLEQVVACC